jgi:5S rRNA maturation endonuclease (ribonuclease M5)
VTYQYHDANGRLVFEKLRYPGKPFVQRKPSGKNGWEYKLGDCEKPLYRLPEVLVANEIIVCEGEKDANNVSALNLGHRDAGVFVAAMTNFDGAGKWREEYAPYFLGKKVVIFPDNDEPGRKHAEQVARSIFPYAAGVKLVALPGLPEKGDVSDFLKDHSAADVIAEIKRAPQWHPAKEAEDPFFVGALTFANSVPDEIDWAVKGIIPRGWNGFIVADPKSLKSFSAIDLLICLSLGIPWLEFEVPRRMRTALLAREDYWGLTSWRIKHFLRGKLEEVGADVVEALDDWMYVNTRAQVASWALDNDADLQRLITELKQRRCEFLVLDVFRRLHFKDKNDNREMQGILDRVARIQAEVGCAIGVVHHTNKGDGPLFLRTRGASAIHGFMEWGIGLSTVNPEASPRERVRRMEFLTKAGCEPDPIYVKSEGGEDKGWIRLVGTEYETPATARRREGSAAEKLMKQ